MSGKQIPDLLNNGYSYWVTKNMLLSHSLDSKVYANLNNKAKLTLELPEYNKYLCLRSKLWRWLFSTFLRSNTMLFLIKRQTKAFELQQYCLLLVFSFLPLFFFLSKKRTSINILRPWVVLRSLISLADLLQSPLTYVSLTPDDNLEHSPDLRAC